MIWELFPQIASLIGAVAGGIVIWNFLRDKPKLAVSPIHPEVYQWFFTLPSGKYLDQKIRKYGFLAYLAILNKGRRDVSVNSWRLHLKTAYNTSVELTPVSIPEPMIRLGQSDQAKVYPVLGQKGLEFTGDLSVKAGSSISGLAYYTVEFWGGEKYNPQLVDGKAIGEIIVKSVFDNKTKAKIQFTKISLDTAKMWIPNIDN